MIKKIIIAIDGYSSTGKSTLAKMLSQYLGYKHINTGSMYRAVTLHAIRNYWIEDGPKLKINKAQIIDCIDDLDLNFQSDNKNICTMYMNNEDVDAVEKSRSTSVGDKVLINNKTFEYLISGYKEIKT